jgi:hypothetical protein
MHIRECYYHYYRAANGVLELSSIGRYRILVFTAQDLTCGGSPSGDCLVRICDFITLQYPAGSVELLILYPPRGIDPNGLTFASA